MITNPRTRWLLAVVLTLSAAVFQRMTGPTYPLKGEIRLDGKSISYKLPRSHGGPGDLPVKLELADTTWQGFLLYKRFKVEEGWHEVNMQRTGRQLAGSLPHQPPAGKLEYFILLKKKQQQIAVPADQTVVTRFKDAVPVLALIPHVFLMFLAMLMSNVTALEALASGSRIRTFTIITTTCLFLGGMIMGPVVQKFAFGAFWTGVPFGWDLTDNKTLLAFIGWLLALATVWKGEAIKKRWWIVAAAVILLLVYSIPHSTLGSELNYETMNIETGG